MKKNNTLRITIVQTKLIWENANANRIHFSELLKKIKRNSTDLIILPEMFNTGFSMNASGLFEKMDGKTVQWMRKLSKEKNCSVCGSIILKENKKYFNRLTWMNVNGSCFTYDKRHLFRMATEEKTFSGGKKKLIVELKGWKICPLVCYDLRFPVWSRKTKSENYDLLIYVANWPERRKFAWQQLLVARAIENQVFVAGINRIGKDGNGINYPGDSVVLNPFGEKISKTKPSVESVETIKISMDVLNQLRKSFPVDLDADEFKINI